jgi:uncharacterized membrane protein YkvA (DUF1232 family)
VLETLKAWAKRIARDVAALSLAARDPRVPWYAKAAAAALVAYTLSPIDLIPDFIPLLGHLDDLVIVPLGIVLIVRLIPDALMAEFRAKADDLSRKPRSRAAAAMIVAVWISLAALIAWLTWPA